VTTAAQRTVFVLVDGENIDGTLGLTIYGRRPEPQERPRWERLLQWVTQEWGDAPRALFFLNVPNRSLPGPFMAALTGAGYRPVPLAGPAHVKVVDVAIQRTLDAINDEDGDVLLVSHDRDFLASLRPLIDGQRRVGVVGFTEHLNGGYLDLVPDGLELIDLEDDVHAFNQRLPRIRVIELDDYDPKVFLH
jgi:uncharacterized protein